MEGGLPDRSEIREGVSMLFDFQIVVGQLCGPIAVKARERSSLAVGWIGLALCVL